MISTSTLLRRLSGTASIARFINRYNAESMGFAEFHEHLRALCEEKNLSQNDVIKNSNIEENYGRQLFKGVRKPSRDKVIQLAIGLGLDLDEAQKLLTVAGKSWLYPKIERDAVIIFALNRGYDIVSVQSTLHELSLALLGEGKR